VPVSLAIEAVLAGRIGAGVSAAPSAPELVQEWMGEIGKLSQHLDIVTLA